MVNNGIPPFQMSIYSVFPFRCARIIYLRAFRVAYAGVYMRSMQTCQCHGFRMIFEIRLVYATPM